VIGHYQAAQHGVQRTIGGIPQFEVQVRITHTGVSRIGNQLTSLYGNLARSKLQGHRIPQQALLLSPNPSFNLGREARKVGVDGHSPIVQDLIDYFAITERADPYLPDVPGSHGKDPVAGLAPGLDINSGVKVIGPVLSKARRNGPTRIRGPKEISAPR
jgi:hypothetical protein